MAQKTLTAYIFILLAGPSLDCSPICCFSSGLGKSVGVHAQTMGGYTQPYRGAQPWTIEPVSTYYGLNGEYSETRFSSVRLVGLPLDDPAAVALGVYLPIDANGDGEADTRDGRPMYAQRDVRDVQPAGQEAETGVRVGRHYLYYRFELGGWAVHTQVSESLSTTV